MGGVPTPEGRGAVGQVLGGNRISSLITSHTYLPPRPALGPDTAQPVPRGAVAPLDLGWPLPHPPCPSGPGSSQHAKSLLPKPSSASQGHHSAWPWAGSCCE